MADKGPLLVTDALTKVFDRARAVGAMAPGEANAFEYDWHYRARPEQLPPAGSWRV
jgi:hypothetical protein